MSTATMPATVITAAPGQPPRAAVAELLEWHPTTGGQRPDADITVLLWITSGGVAEWESGWWNGEAWCLCESGGTVAGTVTHWAEPEGPAA